MGKDLEQIADEALAFGRYLSWADLLNRLFESELAAEVDTGDDEASMEHEWRWYGLMTYWYSSLQVVVEAWDELGFSDPVIDQILTHPTNLKQLLRRYRNATFHYQHSFLDSRFVDLLATGAVHVYWIRVLHDEFVRFFAEFLSKTVITADQRVEPREDVMQILHWYPYRETPVMESLERTLDAGRAMLAKYPGDDTEERREIEHALESGDAALRKGKRDWAMLRSEMLRKAGVE